MHPTVSVIIPVFNGADFICRAVHSALAQSHAPCEVIVVNDGSTDGTVAALACFRQRIRLIDIANGGVANARNVGMLASSGELIAFLDADDVWYPHKLTTQVAALRAHPSAGFCCCDFRTLNRVVGRVENHFAQFAGEAQLIFDQPLRASPLVMLIKSNFVGTCSNVILTRTVMQQVGLFNTGYRQAEDYEYWLRCALVTGFLLMSDRLLEKTAHGANLTNNLLETYQCHERVLLAMQRHPGVLLAGQAAAVQTALARIRYDIANRWFERGAPYQALRCACNGLGTQCSLANFRWFSFLVARKLVRLISFGLLRRRRPDTGRAG